MSRSRRSLLIAAALACALAAPVGALPALAHEPVEPAESASSGQTSPAPSQPQAREAPAAVAGGQADDEPSNPSGAPGPFDDEGRDPASQTGPETGDDAPADAAGEPAEPESADGAPDGPSASDDGPQTTPHEGMQPAPEEGPADGETGENGVAADSEQPAATPDANLGDAPSSEATGTQEPSDPHDATNPEGAPATSPAPAPATPSAQQPAAPAATSPSVSATVSADGTILTATARGGAFAEAWNVSFEVRGPRATRWVAGTRQSDGSWSAAIDTTSIGTGTIRVAGWAHVGSSPAASHGSAQATVPSPDADLSLTFDAAQGKLVVAARNVSCPTGVSFVSVGVVAPSGTTVWQRLELEGDGTWSAALDPGKFSWQTGTYTLLGSICDAAWAGVDIGRTSANVSYGSESATATLSQDGTQIQLVATGGRYSRAWNVSFEVGGPRATVWVAAKQQKDGSWKATCPASKVGAGTVRTSAWASIGSSAAFSAASSQVDVPKARANLSLTYSAASKKIELKATGVSCPTGVSFVSVGVKAPSGAERWYRLERQSDASWLVRINPSDFGWQSGSYTLNGSICDLSWAGVSIGSTGAKLSLDANKLHASTNPDNGTVTLTAQGDIVAGASNVAFAIKGDGSKGHTSTTWHQAYRQSNGTWTATVKASAVGSGQCEAQTVATAGGATRYLATARFSIGNVNGTTSVGSLDDNAMVPVTISGVTSSTGVKSVSVGVFKGSSKQWYACSKAADGTWRARFPVSDFEFAGGTYTFEASITDSFGNVIPLPKVTANVPIASATVEAEVDGPYGTLWLGAGGGAADFAWGLTFSVTDAGGTTDWIPATKSSSGSWTAQVSASNLVFGGGTVRAYAKVGTATIELGSDYFNRPSPSTVGMQQLINGYSSPTGYLLAIDTSNCRVGVFTGSRGHWEQVANWACSPGTSATPTVTGVFSVQDKGYYFDSYGSRCFYYTQFYGDYLFHSTLYYPSGGVMDDRLGMHLSHGCVRLDISNAKWIYDNVPRGTTVVSY